MPLRDLASLNSSEITSFLDSFDDVLCDCDGVLTIGNDSIPGVKQTIYKLRECGKKVRFVSNNSASGMKNLQNRLNSLDFGAKEEDIAYPSLAIIDYLKKAEFNKEVFVLGTTSLQKEISEAGFAIADRGPNCIEETFADLFVHLEDNKNVGAVISDLDLNLNYIRLLKALTFIRRPEVLYITAATDRGFPFRSKGVVIGPKYFQDCLEDLSKRTPLQFGKPAKNFVDYVSERFGVRDASRTLFVGDTLEQDMGFATNGGFQKLLALTGVTTLQQAEKCSNRDEIPDFYIHSFGDLHRLITK